VSQTLTSITSVLAPTLRPRAEELLPSAHPRLGALVSRHFAEPRLKWLAAGVASSLLGALLIADTLARSILGKPNENAWVGPLCLLVGATLLLFERAQTARALGVYERGFVDAGRGGAHAVDWSAVQKVHAVTENGTLTMTVTHDGGVESQFTDRLENLGTIVSIFQNAS